MGTAASSTNLKQGFPSPGPQSPTGQRVMDHVFFLSRSQWKLAREEGKYDLVIIGSGFCGYAVAKRALDNNPHTRILIIERGEFFLPEHFQNLPLPFVGTLGGMSETFPWTLASTTAMGQDGTVRWQHGMVPFFGGRSTLWSAWCPRPTDEEFAGWPRQTIDAARAQFQAAEDLLHVQPADEIDRHGPTGALRTDDAFLAHCSHVGTSRPVYGKLQVEVQERIAKAVREGQIEGVYRSEAAALASRARDVSGIDFQKFAIPGALLQLVVDSRARQARGEGAALDIVSNCVVNRILSQGELATGLDTSRGTLALGDAKLVLAMGTLPPTTLVRNSFPEIEALGDRFTAHFISSIVARVPREDLDPDGAFGDLELGAVYVAGVDDGDFTRQYHIQLSALSDKCPEKNAETALRYMPDVVATASMEQLLSSEDHVVFVCAVLGELDYRNEDSWFHGNPRDGDPTTNSLLRVDSQSGNDLATWSAMDQATFTVIERALSPRGASRVEYWHGAPDAGWWAQARPELGQRRVDALVHEGSTMHIGEDDGPVDLDYRVRGTKNVYMTGGALWPQGGSWNPTLTMVALSLDLADKLAPRTGAKIPGTAAYWIDTLKLSPVDLGGYFASAHASSEVVLAEALPERFTGDRRLYSSNYYLIEGGEVSALHRLNQDELLHYHAGAPARLHVFADDGSSYTQVVIGPDPEDGQILQAIAPHGRWFAIEVPAGSNFVLISASLAPGWDARDSFLPTGAEVEELCRRYAGHAALIRRLATQRRQG